MQALNNSKNIMNVMDSTVRINWLFLFVLVVYAKRENHYSKETVLCLGLPTLGYTIPRGDIVLQYGQSLNITCNVYEKSENQIYEKNPSSELFFVRNNSSIYPSNSSDPVEETAEKVVILNSTSIGLFVKKPACTTSVVYFCKYNNTLTCLNEVSVGIPPQEVQDFSCRSNNWENMTCTWTPPQNYVTTTYNVSFMFKDYEVSGNMTATGEPLSDSEVKHMRFDLFQNDGPAYYRQVREVYRFFLHMQNIFGEKIQTVTWNHFENIYPNPPENLIGNATSTDTIHLEWNMSSELYALPRNLTYRIMYKCEKFCKSWKEAGTFTQHPGKAHTLQYNLTNLDYAHELYDIRVSMKVETGIEATWSANKSITVRTESKRPDYPPRTTLGSFQYITSQNREVYVYFQHIQPEAENGEDIHYVVESMPPLKMVESTKAYAKFEGLVDKTRYVMRIWSENQIGKSLEYSEVVIPAERVKEPNKLTKIEHENSYELLWGAPNTKVWNYTLFWCEHKTERPNQCSGYLNWTVVPGNITKYNMTVPPSTNNNIYQFAIAANSKEGSSSGMLWASCTLLANGTVGKISELWVNSVGSDFIELKWNVDCAELVSEVTGYIIYYCSSNVTYENNCSSPNSTLISGSNLNSHILSGRVTGLKPYTTYLLAVSIKTKSTTGLRSDYLQNNTSEAAPSTPPSDLFILQSTNSTITITWKPSTKPNGKIERNVIYYNDTFVEVNGDAVNYTLTHLESYKSYVISMKACNRIACSDFSQNAIACTEMGVPGRILRPYLDRSNESFSTICWGEPEPARGGVEYYQVIITNINDNSSVITNTTKREFAFEHCGPKSDKYSNSNIAVRAVNIIGNEHYPGPWSEPFKMTSCHDTKSFLILYIFIGILACLGLIYACLRGLERYRTMTDVQVKLPAGLEPAVEHHPEKNLNDIDRYADEELLLQEKQPEKCPAVDSSGCSSGQESITSSVDSTTHLSIDSGTDQPRNVTDDNTENSLRLRNVSNVSGKGYVPHEPTPTINRGTKPTPTPTGNYCVLGVGVDPSNKPAQDTSYVPLSDLETPTPPYVANDKIPIVQPGYTEFFKTQNPGYVPFPHTESVSKNTGYVVAGDLSPPSVELNSAYMLADTPGKSAPVWQQPSLEPSNTKPGYVTVGEASPPVVVKEVSKGYVPHRQFEAKSLKED